MKRYVIALALYVFLAPAVSLAASPLKAQPVVGPVVSPFKSLPLTTTSTTTKEWSFDYSKADLRLGVDNGNVSYGEEDLVNVFLYRNGRLYEDDKWSKNTDTIDFRIWDRFKAIAGEAFVKKHVQRYATYRDTESGVLGFVQLIDKKEPAWAFAVNAHSANFNSKKWRKDMSIVMIHEYAHILSLNSKQVEHKKRNARVCKGDYLTALGCAKKASYINAFSDFWTQKEIDHEETAKRFHAKHKDDFITDYAAKSPEEDFAESFTQFVLGAKPTGKKKEELKVLFFYKYPELVAIRTNIREAIKKDFIE